MALCSARGRFLQRLSGAIWLLARERDSMGFAIAVDSTFDMSEEEYKDLKVAMVPLNIRIGEDEWKDQSEITSLEFYERMAASECLPKTSQPSPHDFIVEYDRLLSEGSDGVLSLHIAGVLSGTVESARLAAGQVKGDVRVVDTLGTSAQAALVLKEACRLRDAGVSLASAQEEIERFVPQTQFLVACETLENLLKGGRLSADRAKDASLLNIKPIFTFDERGVLVPFGKAKGMRGVVKQYVAHVQKRTQEQGKQAIRFCHVGNEAAVESLKKALAEAEVEYVDKGSCPCGATIATHLGMGALGIGLCPAGE